MLHIHLLIHTDGIAGLQRLGSRIAEMDMALREL